MNIDPKLRDFCDRDSQRRIFDACLHAPNANQAAKLAGTTRPSVARFISRLKARAARQGYSPEEVQTGVIPDGFRSRGKSILSAVHYDEDGVEHRRPILQWDKSSIDSERQEALIREAAQAMAEEIPKARPVTAPKATDEALLNLYVITDYHFGMLAWDEETRGEDWDTEIAEELFVNWFTSAIRVAPKARTAILGQLGDFLHWDGLDAVTPTNKHILDADTRFQKVVRVAIRATRRVIRELLKKHEQVHIVMAEGNHDPASSIWLREWFHHLYEAEPRVSVDNSADPYYCYEHGLTSLFFHHGHIRQVTNVDDVFVAKFREVFGRTKYSYGHMGHRHHRHTLESNLMVVEQHRTLASMDAHASRGGWTAGRDASAITYHQKYGEVGRVTVTPEMVREVE